MIEGDKGKDIVVWDIILERNILGFKIWEQAKNVELELAT